MRRGSRRTLGGHRVDAEEHVALRGRGELALGRVFLQHLGQLFDGGLGEDGALIPQQIVGMHFVVEHQLDALQVACTQNHVGGQRAAVATEVGGTYEPDPPGHRGGAQALDCNAPGGTEEDTSEDGANRLHDDQRILP